MSHSAVLGLDCSTEYLALALVDARGGVLARSVERVGRAHAALLPLSLEALLAAAERPRSAIGAMRVGVGPGSYTGTRVAIAAAKGLARALGLELAGVSSFVALAAGVLEPGASAVVTLDARRGNVYAQPCRREPAPSTEAGGREPGPRVVVLAEAVKLPAPEAAQRFGGLRVVPAQAPDAAALAVSAQLEPARARYL